MKDLAMAMTVAAALATTAGMTMASAAERDVPPARTQKSFQELDKNGDGAVSRDEALAAGSLLGHFYELDKDHDGVLSNEEFAAFEAMPAGRSRTAAAADTGDVKR